jgi:hypothetical protein
MVESSSDYFKDILALVKKPPETPKLSPHKQQQKDTLRRETEVTSKLRAELHEYVEAGVYQPMNDIARRLRTGAGNRNASDPTTQMELALLSNGRSALTIRYNARPSREWNDTKTLESMGPMVSNGIRVVRDESNRMYIEYTSAGEPTYDENGQRERGGWKYLGDDAKYQQWAKANEGSITLEGQLAQAMSISSFYHDNRTGKSISMLSGLTEGSDKQTRIVQEVPDTGLPIVVKSNK